MENDAQFCKEYAFGFVRRGRCSFAEEKINIVSKIFKKIFQKKNVEGVCKRLFDKLFCPTFQTQWRKRIDLKLAMRFMDSAEQEALNEDKQNVQARAFIH